jgi:hypothetical protein
VAKLNQKVWLLMDERIERLFTEWLRTHRDEISAELEYRSDELLPIFAAGYVRGVDNG